MTASLSEACFSLLHKTLRAVCAIVLCSTLQNVGEANLFFIRNDRTANALSGNRLRLTGVSSDGQQTTKTLLTNSLSNYFRPQVY